MRKVAERASSMSVLAPDEANEMMKALRREGRPEDEILDCAIALGNMGLKARDVAVALEG